MSRRARLRLAWVSSYIESVQENGETKALTKEDSKKIGAVCTGICANGNSSEVVVEVKCMETPEGPQFQDEEEKIVTKDLIDNKHKEECLHCKELPDEGNLFLWNCTIKVLRTRVYIFYHWPQFSV